VDKTINPPTTPRQLLENSGIPEAELGWLLDIVAFAAEHTSKTTKHENDVAILVRSLADNHELLAIIRHLTAELEAVRNIGLHLTASLELPEVLASIVNEAMRLVKDARDVHIYLYENDKLKFGAALDSQGQRDKLFSQPRQNGLTYNVAQKKEMVIVKDMRSDPLFSSSAHDWPGSIISMPLMVGTRVVGVMNLSRETLGGFSESEQRLLKLFANQAAIAIINARLHASASRQAYTDLLTGLPNRRALDERLEQEVKRASRSGHPLSVVMMDLDGFKNINDSFGHSVGDDILRITFSALGEGLRDSDFLCRYGGDELTLVLPDTPIEQARIVATKLQRKLRTIPIGLPDSTQINLNLSGGIAVMPGHARTAADLLRAADEALYRAKKHQRGTFLFAKPGTGQLPTI
jgi:diguanylate cyclase (GGDEF)-like protein